MMMVMMIVVVTDQPNENRPSSSAVHSKLSRCVRARYTTTGHESARREWGCAETGDARCSRDESRRSTAFRGLATPSSLSLPPPPSFLRLFPLLSTPSPPTTADLAPRAVPLGPYSHSVLSLTPSSLRNTPPQPSLCLAMPCLVLSSLAMPCHALPLPCFAMPRRPRVLLHPHRASRLTDETLLLLLLLLLSSLRYLSSLSDPPRPSVVPRVDPRPSALVPRSITALPSAPLRSRPLVFLSSPSVCSFHRATVCCRTALLSFFTPPPVLIH